MVGEGAEKEEIPAPSEDAWKVKVAGRTFDLKELEELCIKFLKYRIDSENLVHFLKNTTKYDTPDLKEVVISRFVKDASSGFESDQVLELSEQELLAIMERKPEVQAKKVMDVLIRWARKMYKAEKKSEGGEAKEGDAEKKKDSKSETESTDKKDEKKDDKEDKKDIEKKKEDEKSEDAKKDGEKTDTEEKKEPEPEEDEAFFAEEATRQILTRIANVFNDTDLCDATFVVGEGAEKEEIPAPSEDAWKVKVAGRTFDLKELEELCIKFLKYRIDSENLVHFLKNTTKYDTPDLKEVVISRFVKDASSGFESDQVLELSEQELLAIMERKPEVQAKKVMDVLIRWARKMYKAEKKSEGGEAKEGDAEKKKDSKSETESTDKKDEKKDDKEDKKDIEKKKEDEKSEDAKKDGEKTDTEEKKEPEPEEDEDFIEPLQFLQNYSSSQTN